MHTIFASLFFARGWSELEGEAKTSHDSRDEEEYQAVDMDMSPADFWADRDEDFVGWVATFAGSRGGANNAGSASLRTIQRYRAWVQEL